MASCFARRIMFLEASDVAIDDSVSNDDEGSKKLDLSNCKVREFRSEDSPNVADEHRSRIVWLPKRNSRENSLPSHLRHCWTVLRCFLHLTKADCRSLSASRRRNSGSAAR